MNFTATTYCKKDGTGNKGIRSYEQVDFDREAQKVLEEARQKATMIEKVAYEQGFKKGEIAGKELGLQQLLPYIEQFQKLVSDLAVARENMLDRMEPDVIRLALTIAEKVVKKVVDDDPNTVIRVAKEAIGQLVDKQNLVIHVSNADYDLVSVLVPEFIAMEGVDKCKIESDPDVQPGGCILETESGNVDARVKTALEAVNELAAENGD